ncbi:hypothetical protein [Chryseolinea lacunae]|uniref:Uncharacterized protein n=1 Tax=Chryseolinea lacunae TaxID=2801331 RepID=A0ABS1L2G7_9BACT|nr:hypothetical protein [Chryseolinea lacunae]MBL0744741.1 hypothetical protein [Chryseolinea lacunae]
MKLDQKQLVRIPGMKAKLHALCEHLEMDGTVTTTIPKPGNLMAVILLLTAQDIHYQVTTSFVQK